MAEGNQKYYIDKRKYAIRFVFTNKHDALNFRLPYEYRDRFELNNGLNTDDGQYVRIAQIKLN